MINKTYYAFCACTLILCDTMYGYSTIYVPHAISYNPSYEQSLREEILYVGQHEQHFFSAQGYFQKSIGHNVNKSFLIGGNVFNSVNEKGIGDICPLWFQTIAPDDGMYKSSITMNPESFTFGALLQAGFGLTDNIYLVLNTAVAQTQNSIAFDEDVVSPHGTVAEYSTIEKSLYDEQRLFAKLPAGSLLKKTGVDDIQVKLLYKKEFASTLITPYLMLGVPTGVGTKGVYLFEPLVGSKHVQLGLGTNVYGKLFEGEESEVYFVNEIKWYYGLQSEETRSLDLVKNGQWSRFMLLVQEDTPAHVEFAANYTTVPVKVTAGNHLHILTSIHSKKNNLSLEFGTQFFYRQQEKLSLAKTNNLDGKGMGIADLLGIPKLNPFSASTAHISQGVEGVNIMRSDATFVALTDADLDLISGAQKESVIFTPYFSIGCDVRNDESNPFYLTCTGSFECTGRDSQMNVFSLLFGMSTMF
jgi:hypothetical protein